MLSLCKWGRGWMWRSRVAVQIGTKLLIMGDGVAWILKIAISTRKSFARYKLNSTSWKKMVRECMLLWGVRFETKCKWLALINIKNSCFFLFLFLFLFCCSCCCCFYKQDSRGRHQGPLLFSRNLYLTFTYYRCVTLSHCRPTRTD